MKTALLIIMADIGEHLEEVNLRNEVIMNYSIHEAIDSGFDGVKIIVRKEEFRMIHEYLVNIVDKTSDHMTGFSLKNILAKYGNRRSV